MTLIFFLLGWWLSGGLAHAWMIRDGVFTWGDLLGCIVMGTLGPIYAVIIIVLVGGAILVHADFWSKPIFGKKKITRYDS